MVGKCGDAAAAVAVVAGFVVVSLSRGVSSPDKYGPEQYGTVFGLRRSRATLCIVHLNDGRRWWPIRAVADKLSAGERTFARIPRLERARGAARLVPTTSAILRADCEGTPRSTPRARARARTTADGGPCDDSHQEVLASVRPSRAHRARADRRGKPAELSPRVRVIEEPRRSRERALFLRRRRKHPRAD